MDKKEEILFKKNDKTYDCADRLRRFIDEIKDGYYIKFEKGVYRISGKRAYKKEIGISNNDFGEKKIVFYFENKNEITIDGNGATLLFTDEVSAFGFNNCRSVTLKNFKIDYEKNYHFECLVNKIDGEEAVITACDGFSFETAADGIYACGDKLLGNLAMQFDKEKKRPLYDRSYYFLDFTGDKENVGAYKKADIYNKNGKTILRSESVKDFKENEILLIYSHKKRAEQAIFFTDCANVEISDVTINYSPSMGIVGQLSENVKISNVRVELNGRHGMLACTGDATHFIQCSGKLIAEKCSFFNMMDDGMNIHGNYSRVEKVDGDCVTLKIQHAQQRAVNVFKNGDRIIFYRGSTVKEVCSSVVKSSGLISPDNIELVLTGDISGIAVGDLACNYHRMPEVSINGVKIGNNRPRGILLNSSKKTLVENCEFSTCEHGIELAGDNDYWFESGRCEDVTIRNCLFNDCNYSAGSYGVCIRPIYTPTEDAKYYHGKVEILDNRFIGCVKGMVYARGVENITVRGNTFEKSKVYPVCEARSRGSFRFDNCGINSVFDNIDEDELYKLLKPFTACDRIEEEVVTFLGEDDKVPLIYDPKENGNIVLTDYKKTKTYVYGKDYEVKDGKVIILSDEIPRFEKDEFYRKTPDRIAVGVNPEKLAFPDGGNWFFVFGNISRNAARISYDREKTQAKADEIFAIPKKPTCERFLKLLKSGKPTKILYYGDSITEGADASAACRKPPFVDMWPVLTYEFLKRYSGNENLVYENSAVGGKDSNWGLENYYENVISHSPDLLVLAFGMNDGGKTVDAFRDLAEKMIIETRKNLPETEIMLVATSVPNPQSRWYGNQCKFIDADRELQKKYGVALLDMTSLTINLYGDDGIIRYRDFTDNNVNHPNDFGVRIYAQAFLGRLLGENYIKFFKGESIKSIGGKI